MPTSTKLLLVIYLRTILEYEIDIFDVSKSDTAVCLSDSFKRESSFQKLNPISETYRSYIYCCEKVFFDMKVCTP